MPSRKAAAKLRGSRYSRAGAILNLLRHLEEADNIQDFFSLRWNDVEPYCDLEPIEVRRILEEYRRLAYLDAADSLGLSMEMVKILRRQWRRKLDDPQSA
jgi:hypothetical protein